MARVPQGAELIGNPTGGPQGFQMGNVFVMAGVPMVMQAMVSSLTKERLGGTDPVRSRTIGAYLERQKSLVCCKTNTRTWILAVILFIAKRVTAPTSDSRTDEAELDNLKEKLRAMIVDMGQEPHDNGI